MARLIVETGGSTRRFKLGEGKLTLGSGEGATLTLDSDQLAELHAEIEVSGGKVVLRTRKGTTPPTLRGRSVSGDVELKPGVSVGLGDVTLTVEGDAPPRPTPSPRAGAGAARTRAGTGAGARAGAAGPAVGAAGGGGGGTRPRVERARAENRKQSLPSWLIVTLILAAVGLGILIFGAGAESMGTEAFAPKTAQLKIEQALYNADFLTARAQLERVEANADRLDPSWRPIFSALEEQVAQMEKESELLARNSDGDKYFQKQLDNYIDKYLNTPSRPAARILLKRIAWFREEYPRHPKLSTCRSWEERWRPVAKPGEPSTFDDVAYEVKTLTWAMPRDYKAAFAVLDDFIGGASGSDLSAARSLRQEHEGLRRDYFTDRIQQAKYLYKKGDGESRGKAVRELTSLVTKIEDSEMADDAANRLVNMENVEDLLRGFHKYERPTFDELMKNSIVREFVQDKNVIEGI